MASNEWVLFNRTAISCIWNHFYRIDVKNAKCKICESSNGEIEKAHRKIPSHRSTKSDQLPDDYVEFDFCRRVVDRWACGVRGMNV